MKVMKQALRVRVQEEDLMLNNINQRRNDDRIYTKSIVVLFTYSESLSFGLMGYDKYQAVRKNGVSLNGICCLWD